MLQTACWERGLSRGLSQLSSDQMKERASVTSKRCEKLKIKRLAYGTETELWGTCRRHRAVASGYLKPCMHPPCSWAPRAACLQLVLLYHGAVALLQGIPLSTTPCQKAVASVFHRCSFLCDPSPAPAFPQLDSFPALPGLVLWSQTQALLL